MFLQIDDVVLSGMEIPQELPGIGTRQQRVRHEFPGGAVTIQPLGAFPHAPIAWSGLMTGPDAFSRMQRLQRLAALGNSVRLSWGPWAWQGIVVEFEGKAKHQFLVPYTLKFDPTEDLSGIGSVASDTASADSYLDAATQALTDILEGGDAGIDLTGSLASSVSTLLDTVASALAQGGGTVAGISSANLRAVVLASAATAVIAAAQYDDADSSAAAVALDVGAQATLIGTIVGPAGATARQIRVVNPNLFNVAAQYLGDATRWQDIAILNGLTDPQPVGTYTLTVPAA